MYQSLANNQLNSFLSYPGQVQNAMGQMWDVNRHNATMSQLNKDRDLYSQQLQQQQQLQSQLMRTLSGVLGGGSGSSYRNRFGDNNMSAPNPKITATPLQRGEIDAGINAMRQNESVMPSTPVQTAPDANGYLAQRMGMSESAFNNQNAVDADAGLTAQNAELDAVIRNLKAKMRTGSRAADIGLQEDNARRQVAMANPLIRALGAYA